MNQGHEKGQFETLKYDKWHEFMNQGQGIRTISGGTTNFLTDVIKNFCPQYMWFLSKN